jgi:hypothetical protein
MSTLLPIIKNSFYAQKEYTEALQKLAQEHDLNKRIPLQEKVDRTQKAYYASPRGQNELQRRILALRGLPDKTTEQEEELTALTLAYKEAIFTRQAQKAQYDAFISKQSQNLKTVLNAKLQERSHKPLTKEDKATAIAYYYFLEQINTLNDTAELQGRYIESARIQDSNHIVYIALQQDPESKTTKTIEQSVLVLPSVSSQFIQTADYINETLVIPDNDELTNIINNHTDSSTYSAEEKELVENWLINHYLEQGITHFISVNIKTEICHAYPIEKLCEQYSYQIKSRKKLGGTYPYTKGNTIELRDQLDGTPFEDSSIFKSTENGTTHTFLLPPPNVKLLPPYLHLKTFYLSPMKISTYLQDKYDEKLNNVLDNDNPPIQIYEVKNKHQTHKANIYAYLKNKEFDLSETEFTALITEKDQKTDNGK